MDEALRRAYLAAMDIPVWLLRDAEDPLGEFLAAEAAPAPTVTAAGAPASRSPEASRGQAATQQGQHARAILRELGDTTAPVRRSAPAGHIVAPAGAVARTGVERVHLLFAAFGGTLFIDDSADERPSRQQQELLGALGFVLEREKLQPELYPFRWPPHPERAAGEVRDAVMGRLAKLAESMALKRLVLMGERSAALVLGAPDVPDAAPRIHRLERPACVALLIPSLATMLSDPEAKRRAWQVLRLPHG